MNITPLRQFGSKFGKLHHKLDDSSLNGWSPSRKRVHVADRLHRTIMRSWNNKKQTAPIHTKQLKYKDGAISIYDCVITMKIKVGIRYISIWSIRINDKQNWAQKSALGQQELPSKQKHIRPQTNNPKGETNARLRSNKLLKSQNRKMQKKFLHPSSILHKMYDEQWHMTMKAQTSQSWVALAAILGDCGSRNQVWSNVHFKMLSSRK